MKGKKRREAWSEEEVQLHSSSAPSSQQGTPEQALSSSVLPPWRTWMCKHWTALCQLPFSQLEACPHWRGTLVAHSLIYHISHRHSNPRTKMGLVCQKPVSFPVSLPSGMSTPIHEAAHTGSPLMTLTPPSPSPCALTLILVLSLLNYWNKFVTGLPTSLSAPL